MSSGPEPPAHAGTHYFLPLGSWGAREQPSSGDAKTNPGLSSPWASLSAHEQLWDLEGPALGMDTGFSTVARPIGALEAPPEVPLVEE